MPSVARGSRFSSTYAGTEHLGDVDELQPSNRSKTASTNVVPQPLAKKKHATFQVAGPIFYPSKTAIQRTKFQGPNRPLQRNTPRAALCESCNRRGVPCQNASNADGKVLGTCAECIRRKTRCSTSGGKHKSPSPRLSSKASQSAKILNSSTSIAGGSARNLLHNLNGDFIELSSKTSCDQPQKMPAIKIGPPTSNRRAYIEVPNLTRFKRPRFESPEGANEDCLREGTEEPAIPKHTLEIRDVPLCSSQATTTTYPATVPSELPLSTRAHSREPSDQSRLAQTRLCYEPQPTIIDMTLDSDDEDEPIITLSHATSSVIPHRPNLAESHQSYSSTRTAQNSTVNSAGTNALWPSLDPSSESETLGDVSRSPIRLELTCNNMQLVVLYDPVLSALQGLERMLPEIENQ